MPFRQAQRYQAPRQLTAAGLSRESCQQHISSNDYPTGSYDFSTSVHATISLSDIINVQNYK
jgi:hypothetical protein